MRQEPARQIRGGFNGMNRVAGQPQGADNGFDRPLGVKLGLPIERDAVPLVDVAFEVVRQRDGVADGTLPFFSPARASAALRIWVMIWWCVIPRVLAMKWKTSSVESDGSGLISSA